MNRIARNLVFLFFAWIALLASCAAASVSATRTDAGNLYLSGAEVTVADPVGGDLFAAGRRVSVNQAVDADAAMAGATVDVDGDIGQDLRVAGGSVKISGSVGGDLMAAGSTVKLAQSSRVSGDALIAGGEVAIDGKLAHGAKIYAGKISLAGQITGNARLYGKEIVFAPGARIDGDLTYASMNPLSDAQLAQVSGKAVREKTPDSWKQTESARSSGWFHPGFFLSMLACGSLLYILFPNAVAGARETIKSNPLRSLLIGLAILFTVPPVAILFMITIVGIPIGLGLLALYPLLLLLGYLGTAFFIGRQAADAFRQPQQVTAGRQILFLGGALLVLAIVAMIPVIGALAMFLALLVGVGGWVMWLYRHYRGDVRGGAGNAGV